MAAVLPKARPAPAPDPLNEAFDRLEDVLPDRLRPGLRWLHSPRSRPLRLPLGVLCVCASFFWYLPVVGVEFFPFGLLLIAQDVPPLRRPASRLTLWLLDGYEKLPRAWRCWRGRPGCRR